MLDAACNLIVELSIELIPDLAFQHVSIEAQCIKDVSGTQHGMQLLQKLPALIITVMLVLFQIEVDSPIHDCIKGYTSKLQVQG